MDVDHFAAFLQALYKSLDVATQHPSCASFMWLKDPDVRFSRLSVTPSDDNSLYWVDESNKILCLAFPAILEKKVSSLIRDIKGKKKKTKDKTEFKDS